MKQWSVTQRLLVGRSSASYSEASASRLLACGKGLVACLQASIVCKGATLPCEVTFRGVPKAERPHTQPYIHTRLLRQKVHDPDSNGHTRHDGPPLASFHLSGQALGSFYTRG